VPAVVVLVAVGDGGLLADHCVAVLALVIIMWVGLLVLVAVTVGGGRLEVVALVAIMGGALVVDDCLFCHPYVGDVDGGEQVLPTAVHACVRVEE
jgi:hypothetical protein